MKHASVHMRHARQGYIFLVTVTVIGVVAAATATSLMLLGWAAEQNGFVVQNSMQAFEYAQTCAERALLELRTDINYSGDTTFTFSEGTCSIAAIGGAGNENRYLCVEGQSKGNIHRLQIQLKTIFPTTTITDWKEVSAFTLCS